MAMLIHDHAWVFPNGQGERACTKEFHDAVKARDALCDVNAGEFTDDLPSEDWETWMTLDYKINELHMMGHLGEVTCYEQAA